MTSTRSANGSGEGQRTTVTDRITSAVQHRQSGVTSGPSDDEAADTRESPVGTARLRRAVLLAGLAVGVVVVASVLRRRSSSSPAAESSANPHLDGSARQRQAALET